MKFNIYNIESWIVAILIFLSMSPYFVWELNNLYFYIFILPTIIIFAMHFKIKNIQESLLFLFFFIILILAAICSRSNIIGISAMAILSIIPFVSQSFFLSSYSKLRKLLVVVLGISALMWILFQIGIPLPHYNILALNSLKNYNYIAYPLMITVDPFSLSSDAASLIMRFHGPFDEPGVVGTISFIFLLIEKFNLNRKNNIIFLISGLLSLSLFFYVATAVYIIYSVFATNKKVINKFAIILIVIVFFIIFRNNEFIDSLIWNRLEWNSSTSTIQGDNRASSYLNYLYNNKKGTIEYFFGIRDRTQIKDILDSASYKTAVLMYGFVSCFLYLIFFSILSFRKIGFNKSSIMFILFMMLTFYQRPAFYQLYFIYLFVAVVFIHAQKHNIKNSIYTDSMLC